jgi:hypothetical protein
VEVVAKVAAIGALWGYDDWGSCLAEAPASGAATNEAR